MISILRDHLRMADGEIPKGNYAVYVFLEMVALVCLFKWGDLWATGNISGGVCWFVVSIAFFLCGLKWAQLRGVPLLLKRPRLVAVTVVVSFLAIAGFLGYRYLSSKSHPKTEMAAAEIHSTAEKGRPEPYSKPDMEFQFSNTFWGARNDHVLLIIAGVVMNRGLDSGATWRGFIECTSIGKTGFLRCQQSTAHLFGRHFGNALAGYVVYSAFDQRGGFSCSQEF